MAKENGVKRREYSAVKGPQAMVLSIEVVVPIDEMSEVMVDVAEALNQIRGTTTACDVVEQKFVLNSFDEAAQILQSRALAYPSK